MAKVAEEMEATTSISYDSTVIDEIVERVGTFYDGHINENLYCTEEEKKQISKRMKEIYRSVLLENIQVSKVEEGTLKSTNETANGTTVADNQKERHLNEVVFPELDSLICSVAENRKTLPPRCVHLLDQQSRYELKAAVKQEAQVEPRTFSLPGENKEEIEQLRQRVSESSASIKDFSKGIHQAIADVKNLKEVLDMQSTIGKTKIDEIIFSHKPNTAKEEMTKEKENTKEILQIDTLKQGFVPITEEPMTS